MPTMTKEIEDIPALLLTADYREDESLPSLLVRTSAEEGHPIPWRLLDAAGLRDMGPKESLPFAR